MLSMKVPDAMGSSKCTYPNPGRIAMSLRFTAALVTSCSVLGVAVGIVLQTPGIQAASDPDSVQRTSHPRPTNLKVLPKDISGDDIDKLMHGYEKQLGVPCGYCHEQNAETKKIDYASDENPVKQTARFMISMTGDINNKYLAQLGDRRYASPITCGNCHRGQATPPDFETKP
jgi:Photosynthetic reaction centre cytochrome C subunit